MLDGSEMIFGGFADERFVLPGVAFGEKVAAGFEVRGQAGEKTAVEAEAVGTAKEGYGGFAADFGHEVGVVFEVGEIGDDDVKMAARLGAEGRPEIGLQEGDAGGVTMGVAAGDGELFGREVGGGDGKVGAMVRNGNRDGAGAGADIDEAASWRRVFDGPFDHLLGLDARREDVGGDFEIETVEFAGAGEVDEGYVFGAAGNEGLEVGLLVGGERLVVVREHPGAVTAQGVRHEELGVEAGGANAASGEEGGGGGEAFADGGGLIDGGIGGLWVCRVVVGG